MMSRTHFKVDAKLLLGKPLGLLAPVPHTPETLCPGTLKPKNAATPAPQNPPGAKLF